MHFKQRKLPIEKQITSNAATQINSARSVQKMQVYAGFLAYFLPERPPELEDTPVWEVCF